MASRGCWTRRRRGRSSDARSSTASTSSTPPTCIRSACRRRSPAARCTTSQPADKVVLATKAFYPMSDDPNDRGLSRKHLMAAVDNSLRRLGTDYIDLYQIHRWDPHTPIEETLTALHDIVRSGKVRYIGASSMMSWQFAKALHLADRLGLTRFVSMQNHYNLVYREEEREMLPLCARGGIGVIPWSPLARGFLAGNRRSAERRRYRARPDRHITRTACTTRPRTSPSPSASPRSRASAGSSRRRSRSPGSCSQPRRNRADRRRVEDAPARRGGRGFDDRRSATTKRAGSRNPTCRTQSWVS